MAEQQLPHALPPDTPGEETFTAAEQAQPAGNPAHSKRAGAENGSAKRSPRGKRMAGEAGTGANGAYGMNGANGGNGAAPKKSSPRKKPVEPAASSSVTTDDVATPPRHKRSVSQKAGAARRRKTAQQVKKEEAPSQEKQESTAFEAPMAATAPSPQADVEATGKDGAPFEPDLDSMPAQARETSHRSLASLDAELDALLAELALAESLSELEDTMRHPTLRAFPPAQAPGQNGAAEAAPTAPGRDIDVEAGASPGETQRDSAPEGAERQPGSSVDTLNDIPETPMIPALELAMTPETPLPSLDEEGALAETALPAAGEEAWDTLFVEEEVEAIVIGVVETPWAVVEPEWPTWPAVTQPQARPRERWRPLKRVAMALAFLLFLGSSLLLWQNASEPHLYLYALDSGNGQFLARQDLGGYASASALSSAVQDSSSLFVGISATAEEQQQVLALAGSDTSWSVTQQFAAARGRSTLIAGPGRVLAVESGSGLQVMTGDGRALWRVAGDAPLLGAHPFTPAFDASTVYTITSAHQGIVGAYDLHSGTPRWTVQLDDTLDFAPPVLLAGDTLYVAGDHTLYALNTITGGTHWKVRMAARTLLYSQAASPALITAGASGLAAFDPQYGQLLWAFNGQPYASGTQENRAALTAAQFYQAGLLAESNTVYATGLVWDTQRLQQQLWLFAVDASSGKALWSEQIGTGFTNSDGGRVFAPFINASHKLVVIEQAQADGSQTVSAFDTSNGSPRWHVRLAGVSVSAPAPVQLSSGSLGVFSAQSDAGLALRTTSVLRWLLLALAAASLLALLLLWMIPMRYRLSKTGRWLRRLPRTLLAPLRALRHLWRFSRLLFALTLVAILASAGLLTYTQLDQQHPYVRQVGSNNGQSLWQQPSSPSTTLAGVDKAGALLVTGAADHTLVLNALNSSGSPLWKLLSGEGTFSIPPLAAQAGSVLAVLRGPAALSYGYAADDPAYPNPLAHYFALYLLNSRTGAVLWRSVPGGVGMFQDFEVLGEDAQFYYLAGQPSGQHQVAQLLAVDKTDGTIAWRFYGPQVQSGGEADMGAVLGWGRLVYWQVDSTVYALNPQTGQVEWRDAIPEVNAQVAPQEEGQMAAGQDVLLIRRSDVYHALDLLTGAERWTVSGLGVDSAQAPGGIIADGSRFILYGGGTIEAVDAATQNILWQHNDLVAVSNVSLSPDGSLVYAVVTNNGEGVATTQALVAFDATSNLIRWTFQPEAQAQLAYAGAHIVYNAGGMIYLASCTASGSGSCTGQVLYGVDGQTGQARWQIAAPRIYALQASQDGQTLTFQTSSSAWVNLKAMFGG